MDTEVTQVSLPRKKSQPWWFQLWFQVLVAMVRAERLNAADAARALPSPPEGNRSRSRRPSDPITPQGSRDRSVDNVCGQTVTRHAPTMSLST